MLQEKIRGLIEQSGLTQDAFAQKAGISAERVSNICRGRAAKLRREEADALALHFGVNPQWLVNDTGKKMLSRSERETLRRTVALREATDTAIALAADTRVQHSVQENAFNWAISAASPPSAPKNDVDLLKQFVFVPRHEVTASAGHGAVISDESVVDHLAFRRSWIAQSLGLDPAHLALIDARGDSMSPTIESGDLLLLDTREGNTRSEGIYVINLKGSLLVKRLRIKISGTVEVISDNARYGTEALNGDELDRLIMVGRVVWHGRKI